MGSIPGGSVGFYLSKDMLIECEEFSLLDCLISSPPSTSGGAEACQALPRATRYSCTRTREFTWESCRAPQQRATASVCIRTIFGPHVPNELSGGFTSHGA